MKANKLKNTTIALMAATMTMIGHAANAENSEATYNTPTPTNAAARRTVGSVVGQNHATSNDGKLSFTEYHIDEDGDGKADVVRQSINRNGNVYYPQIKPSPFSVLEIIEAYDEKLCLWNIIEINVIDTRKPQNAPVYMPMQNTR